MSFAKNNEQCAKQGRRKALNKVKLKKKKMIGKYKTNLKQKTYKLLLNVLGNVLTNHLNNS